MLYLCNVISFRLILSLILFFRLFCLPSYCRQRSEELFQFSYSSNGSFYCYSVSIHCFNVVMPNVENLASLLRRTPRSFRLTFTSCAYPHTESNHFALVISNDALRLFPLIDLHSPLAMFDVPLYFKRIESCICMPHLRDFLLLKSLVPP